MSHAAQVGVISSFLIVTPQLFSTIVLMAFAKSVWVLTLNLWPPVAFARLSIVVVTPEHLSSSPRTGQTITLLALAAAAAAVIESLS
jgi:hypothetical protein